MKWLLFGILIVILLAIDLFVVNKKAHAIKFKESLIWSGIWIAISCLFGAWIYIEYGNDAGNTWFSAYVIEKSLSMDNLFVMLLIFQYFVTPAELQHTCLFWGIIGVIILRGIFILLGAAIVTLFHPVLYIFGIILIYSAVKIIIASDEDSKIEKNKVVLFFEKHFNVIPAYMGKKFFIKKKYTGWNKDKYYATTLFVTLLMIETTDLIFAVDSIPAAFGITTDPFILYTSNIFAVLGLRSLYFVLANLVNKLWALKYGISLVLAFVGIKMCFDWLFTVSTSASLLIVLSVLLLSGLISVFTRNLKVVY